MSFIPLVAASIIMNSSRSNSDGPMLGGRRYTDPETKETWTLSCRKFNDVFPWRSFDPSTEEIKKYGVKE